MNRNQLIVVGLAAALSYEVIHAKIHSEHVPEVDYSAGPRITIVVQVTGAYLPSNSFGGCVPPVSGQL
jgi:hypothetical protein